ncbi:hypothetical protein [Streptomyces sp. NPDC002588]|uniref:hypothetical protein n=1 Tax=Streptomyces sp. NPDC002588 TaxID=3154419 RepID=UPI00332A3800
MILIIVVVLPAQFEQIHLILMDLAVLAAMTVAYRLSTVTAVNGCGTAQEYSNRSNRQ